MTAAPVSRYLIAILLFSMMVALSFCGYRVDEEEEAAELDFRNISDTVAYVGKETCRQCHPGIYETYMRTGMGLSFDHAHRDKSAAYFGDHPHVYDRDLNMYYQPFWQGDSLKIMEFRLDGRDTVHKLVQTISYIVGSGQHTNSHLVNRHGYVFQAPITFYTQKGQWDLAPGYEDGFNSRFSRAIEAECMTCHNGLPEMVSGSVNKYAFVPQGIDCERCHGPGSLHVKEKSMGLLVDTSRAVDYSILNPAHLSVDRQLDLCQRCHLQGIAVLEAGKDWFDFMPGMQLNEVWNVFLPLYENEGGNFLMASQAERLKKSRCFTESMHSMEGSRAAISCISCHNPHVSVSETPSQIYNKSCQSCHSEGSCNEEQIVRMESSDNCVSCHMPKSGSIDIPHVSITDHNIQVPGTSSRKIGTADDKFLKLECYTDESPDPLTTARAYLKFYEAFSPKTEFLDSAAVYLAQSAESQSMIYQYTAVHLAFLQNNKPRACAIGEKIPLEKITDGWTAYRLGESFIGQGSEDKALPYFQKAVELEPYHLDFNLKLANTYSYLSKKKDAKRVLRFILSEYPAHVPALSNLGYLLSQEGSIGEAEELYQRAIHYNPDYLPAKINLLNLYIFTRRKEEARILFNELKASEQHDPALLQLERSLRQL